MSCVIKKKKTGVLKQILSNVQTKDLGEALWHDRNLEQHCDLPQTQQVFQSTGLYVHWLPQTVINVMWAKNKKYFLFIFYSHQN